MRGRGAHVVVIRWDRSGLEGDHGGGEAEVCHTNRPAQFTPGALAGGEIQVLGLTYQPVKCLSQVGAYPYLDLVFHA